MCSPGLHDWFWTLGIEHVCNVLVILITDDDVVSGSTL